MLFAYFKKEFDSMEWNFLISVLQKFNCGQDFQMWIKLLYSEPCAFIKSNGFFFPYIFNIQGCPTGMFIITTNVHSLYGSPFSAH